MSEAKEPPLPALEDAVVFEAEVGGEQQKLYLAEAGSWVLERLDPLGGRRQQALAARDAHRWLFEQVNPSALAEVDSERHAALAKLCESVPFWWHSIDLGHGVVTPGYKTPEILAAEVANMQLPDLAGRSVLDVGAFDGFFSFEAERRGATRVVALDHFCWCQDLTKFKPFGLSVRDGVAKRVEFSEVAPNFAAGRTPGKQGFDLARRVLGSRVEDRVIDYMQADFDELGSFDVVFFLGVLYHMESPLDAMRQLARATRELAIIETEAIAIAGFEDARLCEFYRGDELQHDPTNWWAPNARAVEGLALEAGFTRVECMNPPDLHSLGPGELHHYRAVLHAHK